MAEKKRGIKEVKSPVIQSILGVFFIYIIVHVEAIPFLKSHYSSSISITTAVISSSEPKARAWSTRVLAAEDISS